MRLGGTGAWDWEGLEQSWEGLEQSWEGLELNWERLKQGWNRREQGWSRLDWIKTRPGPEQSWNGAGAGQGLAGRVLG